MKNLSANATNYLVDGMPIGVKAELVDPMGNLRSSKETIIYWNNETIKQFVDPRDGKKQKFFHGETSYTFALNVGYIESGLWRVRIFDSQSKQPHIYEVPILFLPSTNQNEGYDLLQGSLKLKNVVVKAELFKEELKIEAKTKNGFSSEESTNCQFGSSNCQQVPSSSFPLYEWLVCGGGVVTLILGLVHLYRRSVANRQSEVWRLKNV